ncbi:MAG: hypothetical protein JWN51_1379 [Phycisphaerales bacterium]|nr:hypothetical protein [Phycisphaerales bacterium]
MKASPHTSATTYIGLTLLACFACAGVVRAQQSGGAQQPAGAAPTTRDAGHTGPTTREAGGTTESTRAQSHAQARPETEQQRQQAEQQARGTLDKDAVAAIEETQRAVKAITDGKNDEATAAIERAIGKINVLVARNPANALLPVDAVVKVIDVAPSDPKTIRQVAKSAARAISDRDYPQARVLLASLTSEIRVSTYHLPLASYPVALREASRLLDQKKNKEAADMLATALSTLVVIERVTPLPLAIAQTAINDAATRADNDRNGARQLLEVARSELQRAKELGYAGNDPEYAALDKTISDMEKQLQGNQGTASGFAKLKEEVASFFRRLSGSEKRPETASR